MMWGGKGSKRNKGEGDAVMSVVTFLYTRQLLAKKDEECVWDQTFMRKMLTRLRCNRVPTQRYPVAASMLHSGN